jgi:hypothetical protein
MRVLFSGQIYVGYSQMYLRSDDSDGGGPDEAMIGQANGLCGAAVAGFVYLTTGRESGDVDVQVEMHDAAPPIAEEWQEVVEVSFTPTDPTVYLSGWGGSSAQTLGLECIDYRLRYCVSGMDEGHGTPTLRAPVPERYLLQFWPAPSAPDSLLRQTSGNAAYWHHWAQQLDKPPPTSDEQEQAAQERLRQLFDDILLQFAPDLANQIAAAGAEKQRSMARRAAHRAYESAGLANVDWMAPALVAMDEGQPLPEPFSSGEAATARLCSDVRIPQTGATWMDGSAISNSQQDLAIHAVFKAVKPDALRAAIEAVAVAALSCNDREQLLAEVRSWLAQ